MHFKAIGLAPISQEGEYFENSVWWWPRLWDFVNYLNHDILNREQNTGVMIRRYTRVNYEVAQMIAKRLLQALDNRKSYQTFIEEKVGPCEFAEIIALRAIGGSEISPTDPTQLRFRFHWNNVHKFAIFSRDSGGFVVCSVKS